MKCIRPIMHYCITYNGDCYKKDLYRLAEMEKINTQKAPAGNPGKLHLETCNTVLLP